MNLVKLAILAIMVLQSIRLSTHTSHIQSNSVSVRKYAIILATESISDGTLNNTYNQGTKHTFLLNIAIQYDALIKMGYMPEDVHVLYAEGEIDTTETKYKEKIKNIKGVKPATRQNFIVALLKLIKEANEQDEITIIIQGHGRKTALSSFVEIGNKRITPQDLLEFSRIITAKKQRFIIDACFSGNFKILADENAVVFVSSSKNSPAVASRADSFSRFLMAAFITKESDTNADGIISNEEAFNYAENLRFPYLIKHEEYGGIIRGLEKIDDFKGRMYGGTQTLW